jgi:hypothetical protein
MRMLSILMINPDIIDYTTWSWNHALAGVFYVSCSLLIEFID